MQRVSPAQIAQMLAHGVALHRAGRAAQAHAAYSEILRLQPRHAEALLRLGCLYCENGELEKGAELLAKAAKMNPAAFEAHDSLGNAHDAMGQPAKAVFAYNRALALKPDAFETLVNRGVALQLLDRHAEAIESYDRAIRLRPDNPDPYLNRGSARMTLGQLEAAIADFEQAISLTPDEAPLHANLGLCRQRLGRLGEALTAYDRALALAPHDVATLIGRAQLHHSRGEPERAAADYASAVQIAPERDFLAGDLLYHRLLCADWHDLDRLLGGISTGIAQGQARAFAFPLLAVVDDPALHRSAAELVTQRLYPPSATRLRPPPPHRQDKLRVGYISADFRDHPVADLMVELFETHDRDRFDLTGIGIGLLKQDAMHQRVVAAFDRFHHVGAMGERAAIDLIRGLHLDIAIDLGGHTEYSQPGLFAGRIAPVQASYIGYLSTMGAPYMDHIIGDAVVLPEAEWPHYSEAPVILPQYQANPRHRDCASSTPSRAEHGLPEDGFVFCCFNNVFKLNPDVFDSWARILHRVPGAVLWLFVESDAAGSRLRAEAQSRGIDPARLVFAPRAARPDYVARYARADLFLDTWPYNAGATASDALWAGLPVLTRQGRSFVSRMASSLLEAVGLPELITTTGADYEDLAVALAGDPGRLARLRRHLLAARDTAALFDITEFTRSFEQALRAMVAHQAGGQAPAPIRIGR